MPPRPALTALTLFAALVAWLPAGAASTAAASSAPNTAAPGARIFKLALAGSENGFDPAQVSDVTSASLVGSLFDAPLTYDFLARPMKLKAGAMMMDGYLDLGSFGSGGFRSLVCSSTLIAPALLDAQPDAVPLPECRPHRTVGVAHPGH